MPVSPAIQQPVKVNCTNIVLSNITEKQKNTSNIDNSTSEILNYPGMRDFLIHGSGKNTPKTSPVASSVEKNANGKSCTEKKSTSIIKPVEKTGNIFALLWILYFYVNDFLLTAPVEIKAEPVEQPIKESENINVEEKIEEKVPSIKRKYGVTPSFKTLFDPESPFEIKQNFIAWVNCELKHLM